MSQPMVQARYGESSVYGERAAVSDREYSGSSFVTGNGLHIQGDLSGPVTFGQGIDHEAEAREACELSLFHTDPEIDKQKLADEQGQRVHGTCDWIFKNEQYTDWHDAGSSKLLWLHGPPGVGKTMMARYLTDVIDARSAPRSKKTLVLYYFCDYQDDKRNTEITVLCGLIYLLLKRQPDLIKHLLRDFKFYSQSSGLFSRTNKEALWRNFMVLLSTVEEPTVFCVLDGLDEVGKGPCQWLLQKINEITKRHISDQITKFIVTSTDFDPKLPELSKVADINLDPRHNPGVKTDVDRFIDIKVAELANHGQYNADLRRTVREHLIQGASGTFLWVAFVVPELMETPTQQVEWTLTRFPRKLTNIYMRMLEIKVPEDERAIVAGILHWVAVAVRPLTLTELSEATLVSKSLLKRYIISTGGFLKLSKSEEAFLDQTVRFIHSSAKGSLMNLRVENAPFRELYIDPRQVNLRVATRCFEYIQSSPLKDEWINLRHNRSFPARPLPLRQYPLLDYAARYWPEHARLSSPEVVDMFKRWPNFCGRRSTIRDNWLRTYWSDSPLEWNTPRNFELIHLAAFCGIIPLLESEAVPRLLEFNISCRKVNRTCDHNMTALHWASRNGQTAAVRRLLFKGASISGKGYGMTPLTWAIRNGHLETVNILLANGASVDERDYGMTSLNWAAWEGHKDICTALINKWAELDAPTRQGNSAWLVDAKSSSGEFPWRSAMEAANFSRQSEWVEEQWHARESVIPNLTIALLYAVITYNMQVLRYVGSLILSRSQNWFWLNSRQGNIGGQKICWAAVTPLGRARLLLDLFKDWRYVASKLTQAGREIPCHLVGAPCALLCFWLFANWQGLSTYALNSLLGSLVFGTIPIYVVLFLANRLELLEFLPYTTVPITASGMPSTHRSIWRVLFGLLGIGLGVCHWYGYGFAVNYYPYTYFTFLIGVELIRLGWVIVSKRSDGFTSLHLAASRGHDSVAKLLLRSGADIDAKDDAGRTALQIAIANGNISVERVILGHELVKISPGRVPGSTALQLAAALGRLDLVRDLMAKGCDSNETDLEGNTALHSVAYFGRTTMIGCLFENTTPPIHRANTLGETPLHLACLGGHLDIVNWLLNHGADPFILTEYGFSPLHYAIVRGDLEVSAQLASIENLVNHCGARRITPLHLAIRYKRADILGCLLQSNADPDRIDMFGRSAFDYAINATSLFNKMEEARGSYQMTAISARQDTLRNTVRRLCEELRDVPLESNRLADLGYALFNLRKQDHARTAYRYIFAVAGNSLCVCDGCLRPIYEDMYICHDCWNVHLCDVCSNLYTHGCTVVPGCQNHEYLHVPVDAILRSPDLEQSQIRHAQLEWLEELQREEIKYDRE